MGEILDDLLFGGNTASWTRGRAIRRVVYLILVWTAVLLGAGTLHAWIMGSDVRWVLARLACGSVAGVPTGALGGLLASRREDCRALRFYRREAAMRGAWYGLFAALGILARFATSHAGPGDCIVAVVLGACIGLIGGLSARFLNPAERAYARAVQLLKKGDTWGAYEAAKEYLKHANKDPLRAVRREIVDGFVKGKRGSLDVAVELEAAPAPGGRGTEPEAGSAREGRGTELSAEGRAPDPPDRSDASDPPATHPTCRQTR